jgi:hypothetical protein
MNELTNFLLGARGSFRIFDTLTHTRDFTTIIARGDAVIGILTEKGITDPLAEHGLKDTKVVTLTGTSGTANITADGLVRLATWNTSLTQTAADFVTTHAAAYLAIGITVTANAGVLTFAATTKKINGSIANVSGTLNGTWATVYDTIADDEIIIAKTKFTSIKMTSGPVTIY